MEKELKKVTGADNVVIELEEEMISINTPKSQTPEEEESLSLTIQNTGYALRSIKYSKSPFKRVYSK